MPGKARFYNNRRPLNPRRNIIQVPEANSAFVTVTDVNNIGGGLVSIIFDCDILNFEVDYPTFPVRFIPESALPIAAPTFDNFFDLFNPIDGITQVTPREFRVDAGGDPGNGLWAISLAWPSTAVNFIGRILNQQQLGVIATP